MSEKIETMHSRLGGWLAHVLDRFCCLPPLRNPTSSHLFVMAAPIPQEVAAVLVDVLGEFMVNPAVQGFVQNAQNGVDPFADAHFQAAVADMVAALQAAGIEVPPLPAVADAHFQVAAAEVMAGIEMPQHPVAAEAPVAWEWDAGAVAGANDPLNFAFADEGDDDQTINCDVSTVYQGEIDEMYEEAMTGHGLPGVLINVAHDAQPLLAFVRAQDDLPNLIKNGFYFDLKVAIYRLVGNRITVPLWRSDANQALANLLPHLAADTHGLVVDLMEQLEQSLELAANWMLQNLLPDNTLADYPLTHMYYVFYVRRQLRYPSIEEAEEAEEAQEAAWENDAEEAVPLLQPELPLEQQPA